MWEISDLVEGLFLLVQDMSMLCMTVFGLSALLTYFVWGYTIMCTGRKADVEGDFLPFLPIGSIR